MTIEYENVTLNGFNKLNYLYKSDSNLEFI